MAFLSDPVIATLIGLLGTICIGLVVDRVNLGLRVSVMEALFNEKSKSVGELGLKSDQQANRITAVEAVIPEIKTLVNALASVPVVLARLETLMENNQERIRDMEQHVFPFNRPQQS